MTDSIPTVTAAAESLWRATCDLLRAVAADPETEAQLLARLERARRVSIVTDFAPTPAITVAGVDADGPFAKTLQLRSISDLN